LPWLIAIGAITVVGYSLSSDIKDVNATQASNCDKLFRKFDEKITISSNKKSKLKEGKDKIKDIIKKYSRNNNKLTVPGFKLQGSYKMGTLIKTQNNKCDIDYGIYFFSEPNISNETIFNNIKKGLVKGEIREKDIILKKKCIRVVYSKSFHIDYSVYYFDKIEEEPYLLPKSGGLEPSDPKRVWEWFRKKRNNNGKQVLRLVRYFKAWGDFQKHSKGRKMPSGLALSVWAAHPNLYHRHERDDVALFRTVLNLYKTLSKFDIDEWECELPVHPYDNLIEDLNYFQRDNFLKTLENLVWNASIAITAGVKEDAIEIWRGEFGKRFPQRT